MTISAASACTAAGISRAVSAATIASGCRRSVAGMASDWKTADSTTRSAKARLSTSVASKMFRRSVFDRGSSTAINRLPGYADRRARNVSRIAVGWWAKSSITVTPPTSARTSSRRLTLRKVASASAMAAAGMPCPAASAAAAVAFMALCSPAIGNASSAKSSPARSSRHLVRPSSCRSSETRQCESAARP